MHRPHALSSVLRNVVEMLTKVEIQRPRQNPARQPEVITRRNAEPESKTLNSKLTRAVRKAAPVKKPRKRSNPPPKKTRKTMKALKIHFRALLRKPVKAPKTHSGPLARLGEVGAPALLGQLHDGVVNVTGKRCAVLLRALQRVERVGQRLRGLLLAKAVYVIGVVILRGSESGSPHLFQASLHALSPPAPPM